MIQHREFNHFILYFYVFKPLPVVKGQFIIKPNLWFVIAIAIIEGLGDWSANGLDIGFISVDMNGWKGGRDNTITTITLSQ